MAGDFEKKTVASPGDGTGAGIHEQPATLMHALQSWGDLEIQDCDLTGNVSQVWLHTKSSKADYFSIVPVLPNNAGRGFFLDQAREWRKAIFDSFLPVGFPHSVSDDYLAYQTYDSLQAFFSTITGLLANRALLAGLGVGDANSSATFAMLLTILKDGMSRIATIVFANRFGLRIEPDAKRYRFLADVLNDTAFFLELWSPFLGSLGKVIALSIGEALRALCGVAAGASKAALSVHFAKHDNLAELNAKEASQETAVGLVGLLAGSVVVKYVEDPWTVVYLMIFLVFSHLWVNYLGVRCVVMNTLNRQRAIIVFEEYLKSTTVLSPKEVAQRENILLHSPTIRNRLGQTAARLEFATSYHHAIGAAQSARNIEIVDTKHASSIIVTGVKNGVTPIRVLLWENAESRDIIAAWFNSMRIAQNIDPSMGCTASRLEVILSEMDKTLPQKLFAEMQSIGWDLDRAQDFETAAPVRVRIRPAHRKSD